jgi:hypothetical protein
VDANQFNANWLASANATGYILDFGTNATFNGRRRRQRPEPAGQQRGNPRRPMITGDWSGARAQAAPPTSR